MNKLYALLFFVVASIGVNQLVVAKTSVESIALFNLTPISMDAIGADADLLYSLETELTKSSQVSVMSRRDIEAVLYRIGGAQVSDTNLVIAYGQEMGVTFVLTGEIDKIGSSIQISVNLIDIIGKGVARTWTESYTGRGDILQRSKELAAEIEASIIQTSINNLTPSKGAELAIKVDHVVDVKASAKDGGINLRWKIAEHSAVFYTNIYRGSSAEGLFEFVASVEETEYQDDVQGQFFYRLDAVLDSGVEIKGEQVFGIKTSSSSVDLSLKPPTILSTANLLQGIKIDFVPQLNNQGVVGYNFYQKANDSQWRKVHSIEKTNQLTYSVVLNQNFVANSGYQIYVTAYSREGESEQSRILELSTSPMLTLNVNSDTQLRKAELSWDKATTGSGYNLYRQSSTENTWQLISKIVDINTVNYLDDKALKDGTQYLYTITAYDDYTETAKSAPVTVQTKPLPAAPLNFSAQAALVKTVKLTWQASDDSDISGYAIYRKAGEFSSGDLLTEIAFVKGHQQAEYIDGLESSPLNDGESYHYAIAAKNLFNTAGKVSTAVSATTKPLPEQPQGLMVSVNSESILLNWQANPEQDIKHYAIYRQWNQEPWVKITESKALSFSDQTLKVYAQTSYKISAISEDGLISAFSGSQSVVSPLILTLAIEQDDLLRTIILTWNNVNDIDGYKLYRKSVAGSQWQLLKTLESNQQNRFTDFDKKALREGKKYQYKLTAFDQGMETQATNVVTGKTKDSPAAPINFSASNNEVQKSTLTWASSIDNDNKGYIIYRRNKAGEYEELKKISNLTITDYEDDGDLFSNLGNGQQYSYAIATYNKFGTVGPLSEAVNASTKPIPNTIGNLSLEYQSGGLMFFWGLSSNTDIDKYQVYRSTNLSCSNLRKLATVDSTSDIYLDVNVKSGKSYCYQVTAIDIDKLESQNSQSVTYTLPAVEGDK